MQEYMLDYGKHSFIFLPGKEYLYFLTARTDQQSQTIKMFNSISNAQGSGICNLKYKGQQSSTEDNKSGNNLNNFIFHRSDRLQYMASSTLGKRTIIDSPLGNQAYTFQYGSGGMPCPGTPTVTDIDGNVYNAVQIGIQCWMKENLKTTTYSNGSSIPNITDPYEWTYLTTGAYAWYDNDISWKDSYGALYNWHAVDDANRLCPTGWHVPTNDEWTALTDFIGGTGEPNGNELKSCRQVSSPLGGECNTSEHPRWEDLNSSIYGTDNFGFSGLPGSYRTQQGDFIQIGTHGIWWSSTEYSSNYAWTRYLHYYDGRVNMTESDKQSGLSVRCLRD